METPKSKKQTETPDTEKLLRYDIDELLKTPKNSPQKGINSPKTPFLCLNSPRTPNRKVLGKNEIGSQERDTTPNRENDFIPRTPSPFVIKRPFHHNANKKLKFDYDPIDKEHDDIEKIKQKFFLEAKKKEEEEQESEDKTEETEFSLSKRCFNPEKLFCNFDSKSWDSNKYQKINSFIFKNMLSTVQDPEGVRLAVLMCSVSHDVKFCDSLYKCVEKTFLPFDLFDSIVKNWGFDESQEINTKDTVNISHNICLILNLLSDSVEKYSLEDLSKCFHYLICFSSDPISQSLTSGLASYIQKTLINCIKALQKFELTNENIFKIIEIDVAPIFLISKIFIYLTHDPSSYPLLNLSIIKSINLSLNSQIILEDIPETILKFLIHIEQSFWDLDIDNLCSSLILLRIILARTSIEKESKPIFCQICETLLTIEKKSKNEYLTNAIKSLHVFCITKIKPFLINEENFNPYFQITYKIL